LIPGFSTRAVVTQTSGRGIGMDAIQTKISSIQGQMNLQSVRGEGLTIEITIPLTLSSMLSLLVKCGGQTMAISNRGLRKIHHADECVVVQEEEQLFCEIEAQRYQAKYFAELVGIPMNYSAAQKLQALRIEDEIGRSYVIFVEELLGYRDLLVKNMGSYIPHIQGITGASILGNGAVAPVIDLVEMLHHAVKYDYVLADATKALADSIHGLPVALVIDDSLSARRSVAMLLKDSGLEVETAIDGLDALKYLEKAIPDIILVDLEMPRMNGIELTAHVRNREDMKNTPIIMITSRATEKHRKQAEAAGVTRFMTKPFTEDDLINSVRGLMQ
jgi:chemosensory pili system protein ChpA (sensor histidine kinase/response regulator)